MQALIIDSWFDNYVGVISLVRVMHGTLRRKQKIRMMSTKGDFLVEQVGIFTPRREERDRLKAGDVVVSINGAPVKSASAMRNMVGLLRVGEEMNITVIREGKKKTMTAVIRDAKDLSVSGTRINQGLAGATIEEKENGGKTYLTVTEVEQGSPAWNAHLREGDIILSVNRRPVQTLKEQ